MMLELSHRRSRDRRFQPPSRNFRGGSGFLGSSTRMGNYGFFSGGGAGGGGNGGFFDPFREPQPYPVKKPKYMNWKFKPFGRRGIGRAAHDAVKLGFGLSPLHKGLLALEIADGAMSLAELAVGYYAYNRSGDISRGGWYTKREYLPPEWHVPPGYSCYSYKPGICGGGENRDIYQQYRLSGSTNCATWHYCLQAIQPNPPADANFFLGGPANLDILRFGVELVVLYPRTGGPYPKPWYGPTEGARTLPFPQTLDPEPAAQTETFQPPSNGGNFKRPPYTTPAYEAASGNWRDRGPKPHARKPPDGYKERKKDQPMRAVLKLAGRLYGHYTEAADAIEAIHDALPAKYQVKKGGPAAQARAIYDHFDELDLGKAAGNLIYNHYEDKAIGKLHSYGKKSPFGTKFGRYPFKQPGW